MKSSSGYITQPTLSDWQQSGDKRKADHYTVQLYHKHTQHVVCLANAVKCSNAGKLSAYSLPVCHKEEEEEADPFFLTILQVFSAILPNTIYIFLAPCSPVNVGCLRASS